MSEQNPRKIHTSVWQEGNNLFSTDYTGSVVCIGVTADAYKELQENADAAISKAEEYFEELVRAGLRVRPKTADERIDELAAQNAALMKKLTELTEIMGKSHEHTGYGEEGGAKPGTRKPRNADGGKVSAEPARIEPSD